MNVFNIVFLYLDCVLDEFLFFCEEVAEEFLHASWDISNCLNVSKVMGIIIMSLLMIAFIFLAVLFVVLIKKFARKIIKLCKKGIETLRSIIKVHLDEKANRSADENHTYQEDSEKELNKNTNNNVQTNQKHYTTNQNQSRYQNQVQSQSQNQNQNQIQ